MPFMVPIKVRIILHINLRIDLKVVLEIKNQLKKCIFNFKMIGFMQVYILSENKLWTILFSTLNL